MKEDVYHALQSQNTRQNTQSVCCSTGHALMSNCQVSFINCSIFESCSLQDWPKSTKVACWYCTEKFKGRPFCLPVDFDATTTEWRLKGCFCSVQCTLAYIQDYHSQDYLFSNMLSWTKLFARMYFGITNVTRAPSRCLLKKFGGHISIQQFRQHNEKKETIEVIHEPIFTFVSINSFHEEKEKMKQNVYLGKMHGIGIQNNGSSREKSRYQQFLASRSDE